MARSPALEELAGIDVYFAEPHSPWQRPSNEAFNGLLRLWLPESSDLSIYDQDDLDSISHRINTIPRPPPVGDRLRLLPSECCCTDRLSWSLFRPERRQWL